MILVFILIGMSKTLAKLRDETTCMNHYQTLSFTDRLIKTIFRTISPCFCQTVATVNTGCNQNTRKYLTPYVLNTPASMEKYAFFEIRKNT
jgi:hypothetical protein